MKRDMDLVRNILLTLEQHPEGYAPSQFAVENYDEETIGFHVHLMGQAGLLQVIDVTSQQDSSPAAIPLSVTWKGYEFLDNAKNETVWNRTKRLVTEKGGSISFDLLSELLKRIAGDQLLGGGGVP